ncbi:uncharacterized protein [Nicotiana sylvestris]|uniref:uncharacterized protein n=1 Tax=Nicotiana sylvestris TaxID=4096 RepID=UPI00388C6284
MAMTTRSRKGGDETTSNQKRIVDEDIVVKEDEIPSNVVQANEEVRIDIDESVEETQEEVNPSREHVSDMPKAKAPMPRPPPSYPQRLAKQNNENQFKKFIDMMKRLSINVPLVETMKRPLGIIDDVSVRVDKFILPADFVILDCEVDYEVPIILGRPFLTTGKTLVDVKADELTFRAHDKKVVFHVSKSMRQPNSNEVCSFVNLVTECKAP